jgi:hypothetical protein
LRLCAFALKVLGALQAVDHAVNAIFDELLAKLEGEPDVERRWARWQEVNRELSRLRREDHQAVRAQSERAAWQKEQAAAEREAELVPDKEGRQLLCEDRLARLEIPEMAEKFGGD